MMHLKNKFVHEVELSDSLCLYNSLTHDIIYLRNKEYIDIWNSIAQEGCASIADKDFQSRLLEKGFLVSENFDYDSSINKILNPSKNKKNAINIVYFVPTIRCNMLCKYCHIKNGKFNNEDMTTEIVDSAFEKLMKYNDKTVETEIIFYGGEPTLNFDIVKYIVEKGKAAFDKLKITMFTNATLIDDEIAQYIKDNGIFTIVSLDGLKEDNDKARVYCNGGGTFNEIIRGYGKLKEHGCSAGISLVMGSHNIDNLEEDVKYILDELKPIDIGLSTLHMMTDGANPMEVEIEHLTEKMIKVFDIARSRNVYIEHLFRRIRPIVEMKSRVADCPSCGSKLLITPWNTIAFCEAYMQEDKYTYDMDRFDIFNNEDYNEWAQRTPFTVKDCHDCIALSVCGGGCPYDAEKRHGHINDMDGVRCVQSIMLIKWCLSEIYRTALSDKADGYFIPTIEDRKKLYGGINFDSLPLRLYSEQKEQETGK